MDGETRDLSEKIRKRERLHEDVRRALKSVLLANRSRAGLLFATAAAQRTFTRRDELPADEREPYSEVWRPTLEALWAYAAGAHTEFYAISGSHLDRRRSAVGFKRPPPIPNLVGRVEWLPACDPT